MKPLLAGKVLDVHELTYPLIASPKIDGIRCLTFKGGVAKSRSLKEIPNEHIQTFLQSVGIKGLDGELMIPMAKSFGEVSSAIMKEEGYPNFIYYVFDKWDETGTYQERLNTIKILTSTCPSYIKILHSKVIQSPNQLTKYETNCLFRGHEGVMIRSPEGKYKFGRSTTKEQILLKLKRFTDSEAVVIGYEEKIKNTNKAELDNLGHSKRSSHKINKILTGELGSLQVRDISSGVEFAIGSGYNDEMRNAFWVIRSTLLGKIVKYRYQTIGMKQAPRFPIFLGFRDSKDM